MCNQYFNFNNQYSITYSLITNSFWILYQFHKYYLVFIIIELWSSITIDKTSYQLLSCESYKSWNILINPPKQSLINMNLNMCDIISTIIIHHILFNNKLFLVCVPCIIQQVLKHPNLNLNMCDTVRVKSRNHTTLK